MIKLVITVWRRPEYSNQSFIDRWKGEHAALVMKYAPVLRMKRYVQSHRIPSSEIDAFSSGRGWAPASDGITEIWWNSPEDLAAGFGSPEGQEASVILRKDEEAFVEMRKVTALMSVEHTVFDFK